MKFKMLLLIVLVITACAECSNNELKTLPEGIIGEWETTTPKYNGFTFTLTDKTIIFNDENSDKKIEVFKIDQLTKDIDKDNRAVYTVHYKGENGLKFKFAFFYNPTGGGQIILKNQAGIIWTKCPVNGNQP